MWPAKPFKLGDIVVSVSDKVSGIKVGNFYTLTRDAVFREIQFKDDDGAPRTRPASRYKLTQMEWDE